MSDTNKNTFHKLQCAFESQQQVVCNSYLEAGKVDVFSFKDHTFIPTDFLAFSYVCSNASHKVTTLTFTNCTFAKEEVELLIELAQNIELANLKTLNVKLNRYRYNIIDVFQI